MAAAAAGRMLGSEPRIEGESVAPPSHAADLQPRAVPVAITVLGGFGVTVDGRPTPSRGLAATQQRRARQDARRSPPATACTVST